MAVLGTSVALLNLGFDVLNTPRLRAAGLSRGRARRAGVSGLPKHFVLGFTPVIRQDDPPAGSTLPAGSDGQSWRSGDGR